MEFFHTNTLVCLLVRIGWLCNASACPSNRTQLISVSIGDKIKFLSHSLLLKLSNSSETFFTLDPIVLYVGCCVCSAIEYDGPQKNRRRKRNYATTSSCFVFLNCFDFSSFYCVGECKCTHLLDKSTCNFSLLHSVDLTVDCRTNAHFPPNSIFLSFSFSKIT